MSGTEVTRLRLVPVDEYLHGESTSDIKHEYVGGAVYAMVGGRYAHNLIASNVLIELGGQLKGQPCRALNSDSRVKIKVGSQTRFYYPDVSVVCDPDIRDDLFQDCPSVLVEVMSRSTRRQDEGEKREAYLVVPSLSTYLLLEQEFVGAIVYQRHGKEFSRTVYSELSDVIDLPGIRCQLNLSNVYSAVKFDAESIEGR